MQAAEKNLLEILSRMSRQYRVPLFQRRYVWDEEQWCELWDDLVALAPEGDGLPSTRHFVGSIVTQQGDGALKNVVPFMVIDGQQRLTTFLLLLKAMDDHAAILGADLRDLLRGYLRNPSTKGDDVFRVLPTDVASGVPGYHFHQYHRVPGAHPLICRHGFAQRSKARA